MFYGCEGSFAETTHAYGDFGLDMLSRITCNGETFLTSTDMMVQVENLGELIRQAPAVFKERSGGLLAAYVKDPHINTEAVSKNLYDAVMESHRQKEMRNAKLEAA